MGMRIYLAKTAHHQLIPNIYHKSEKGKPYKMDSPFLKNGTAKNLGVAYMINSLFFEDIFIRKC